jgi:hypothetical protein
MVNTWKRLKDVGTISNPRELEYNLSPESIPSTSKKRFASVMIALPVLLVAGTLYFNSDHYRESDFTTKYLQTKEEVKVDISTGIEKLLK